MNKQKGFALVRIMLTVLILGVSTYLYLGQDSSEEAIDSLVITPNEAQDIIQKAENVVKKIENNNIEFQENENLRYEDYGFIFDYPDYLIGGVSKGGKLFGYECVLSGNYYDKQYLDGTDNYAPSRIRVCVTENNEFGGRIGKDYVSVLDNGLKISSNYGGLSEVLVKIPPDNRIVLFMFGFETPYVEKEISEFVIPVLESITLVN